MRIVNVAAAQMGPIQKADSREAVVKLGELGDRKALSTLKSMRIRGAFGSFVARLDSRGNNMCLQRELAAAIKSIEDKP